MVHSIQHKSNAGLTQFIEWGDVRLLKTLPEDIT